MAITAPEPPEAIDGLADAVNALVCSPEFARDGVCFAARSSGLYRSSDGGATWQAAYGSLALAAPLGATAVALSPAFAHDRTLFAGANGGVLRSADGGDTWQISTLPEPAPLVTALATSPAFADDGLVFAGTIEDGIFRSADGGRSWQAWNFGLLDHSVLALAISPDFARDETVLAGTDSGLFCSTNGGRGWRAVVLPFEFAPVLSVAWVGAVVLVGTESDGLYRSDDARRTWRRVGADALEGAVNTIIPAAGFPEAPELLVLLNDVPVVSYDAGHTWAPWPAASGHSLSALAAPGGLAAPLLAGLSAGGVVQL